MNVIQLREPKALLIPEFQNFLTRVVNSGILLSPATLDQLAEDFFRFITDPEHFMLVGAEDGTYASLLLGYFGTTAMFPYPTIVALYNEGSDALRKATVKKAIDLVQDRGYTKVLALNTSGHSDKAWTRLLAPAGYRGTVVGSFTKFEVE